MGSNRFLGDVANHDTEDLWTIACSDTKPKYYNYYCSSSKCTKNVYTTSKVLKLVTNLSLSTCKDCGYAMFSKLVKDDVKKSHKRKVK